MIFDLCYRVSLARRAAEDLLDQGKQEIILDPLPMTRPLDLAVLPLCILAHVLRGLIPWQFCKDR